MEIEFLHALHGDKKKNFDTETAAGRIAFADAVTDALQKGTAIFLERGEGTYMVLGYDPNRDKLKVRLDVTDKKTGKRISKSVGADPKKGKATAVAPVRGGVDVEEKPETRGVGVCCAETRVWTDGNYIYLHCPHTKAQLIVRRQKRSTEGGHDGQ